MKLCFMYLICTGQRTARSSQEIMRLKPYAIRFFCNSGTESLETSLKIARKYGRMINEHKSKVIVMNKAFHGRTSGALSLTWNSKYKEPFGQLLEDIEFVALNDKEALDAAVDDKVCAIIIEPIQGEGGIYSADAEFLKLAKHLASEYNALLIFDEVQCGIGRSGKNVCISMEWRTARRFMLGQGTRRRCSHRGRIGWTSR